MLPSWTLKGFVSLVFTSFQLVANRKKICDVKSTPSQLISLQLFSGNHQKRDAKHDNKADEFISEIYECIQKRALEITSGRLSSRSMKLKT